MDNQVENCEVNSIESDNDEVNSIESNKGGRPPVELTAEQTASIKVLAQFLSKEQLADYLGVSRPTFNAILARDEQVSLHYNSGKAIATLNVSKSLINKAIAGNMPAAIFYLKTQAGWKETQIVDNTSSDGSMSTQPDLDYSKLTDKELRDLAAITTKAQRDSSGAGET